MIKNECDIVKDLLPNYVENQINDNTKEFVDKHTKNCNKCSEMLKMLKGEQTEEEMKSRIEDIEIDYLKKYNKKIKILKYIAIVLGTIIITLWGVILSRKIEDPKEISEVKKIYNEISRITTIAEKNTEEFFENNNFMLKKEYNTKNPENAANNIIYFRDNKYKEIYDVEKAEGKYSTGNRSVYIDKKTNKEKNYINYGANYKDRMWHIPFIEDRILEGGVASDSERNNIYKKYVRFIKAPGVIDNYGIDKSYNYEIREENNCYVIRMSEINNKKSYEEQWIDKEKMLLIKEVNNNVKINKTHSAIEINYIYETGTVKDEDVMLSKEQTDKVYEKVKLLNQIENGTYKIPENDLIKIKPILAY